VISLVLQGLLRSRRAETVSEHSFTDLVLPAILENLSDSNWKKKPVLVFAEVEDEPALQPN